jgi:major membrane immunogen (membrane-anchored lipoprotein)
MKKTTTILGLTLIIIGIILAFSSSQLPYHDGLYTGKSQARYTNEPYIGNVNIEIKKGEITNVKFTIVDTALKELFDEKYEKHFEGNNLYMQQCRNDWKGVQTYPSKLLKTQNIDNVDAISGATWSYNIFKASVKEALKGAKK